MKLDHNVRVYHASANYMWVFGPAATCAEGDFYVGGKFSDYSGWTLEEFEDLEKTGDSAFTIVHEIDTDLLVDEGL